MRRKLAHWLIRKLADRYGFGMSRAEIERRILYCDEYRPVVTILTYDYGTEPENHDPYSFLKPDGLPLCSTTHPLSAQEPE